jgi:hypothetical protein
MNALQQLSIVNKRLSICISCERLEPTIGYCLECICDVYDKTRLMGSGCPLGKWTEHDWTA